MAEYKIDTSELREYCGRLRAGDRVLLSGTVYTSRDAAHKRICALLDSGEELPFDLKDYRCDKAQQCRISLRDRRRRRACFKVHNKMRGDSVF